MKKKSSIFKRLPGAAALIIGMALVIAATALVSCDNGSDDGGVPAELQGTWLSADSHKLIFTASTVQFVGAEYGDAFKVSVSGSTITVTEGHYEGRTATYSISGTTLTIAGFIGSIDEYNTTYTRQ